MPERGRPYISIQYYLKAEVSPPLHKVMLCCGSYPYFSLRALILLSLDFGSQVRQYNIPLLLPSQDR